MERHLILNLTSVPVPLAQVLPHPQLIFPSKTWFFEIYLNFQLQKSLYNSYLPHSESKSYQINSIKSCSSRSFQEHHTHIPIPLKFNLIQFSVKKSFNIQELVVPSPCTPPLQELSKTPRT